MKRGREDETGTDLVRKSETSSHFPEEASDLGRPSWEFARPSCELDRPKCEMDRPSREFGRAKSEIGRPSRGIGRPKSEIGRASCQIGRPSWEIPGVLRRIHMALHQRGEIPLMPVVMVKSVMRAVDGEGSDKN